MSDDLDFLRARVPDYHGYGDADSRHDSDMRVRAYLGVRLADIRLKAGGTIGTSLEAQLDRVIFHCEFSDQAYIKLLDRAELDASTEAILVHSDRAIVELADRIAQTPPAELGGPLTEVESQFEGRAAPLRDDSRAAQV